ncbi:hypothetical protein [Desulfosarcina ovata]|uniref:Uncharacterized protein n=1 Tax=Desulfosarcina ovata subsp. ovata TaxID=2752305 RepID=A0A5K8A4H9_9BACT|nr:hypothetical protein [Desulfosarcina ovata]BBO87419.1 hypothetical protein DSCOOX_05990 [Desulfosarcina ovata subsp. ovata]
MRKNKITFNRYQIVGLFLTIALLALSPQRLIAGTGVTKTVTVTITHTTEDDFTCDQGQFRITEKTKLVNSKGKVIPVLGLIDLPCRATVTYDVSDMKIQNAIEVKVIESLKKKQPNSGVSE